MFIKNHNYGKAEDIIDRKKEVDETLLLAIKAKMALLKEVNTYWWVGMVGKAGNKFYIFLFLWLWTVHNLLNILKIIVVFCQISNSSKSPSIIMLIAFLRILNSLCASFKTHGSSRLILHAILSIAFI